MSAIKFRGQRQEGFNLLEVVIGVAIFAIGMLAIAAFQGALTRSTAESQARSVAGNIAERLIEERRGFSRIEAGSTPNIDYNEIVDVNDGSLNETHHGVTYTVGIDVTDWYYSLATDSFSTTAPAGAFTSDFKAVVVTVGWDDARDFRVSDGVVVTQDTIQGGSIALTASISSTPTPISGRVALEEGDDLPPPVVDYSPGQNPDVVSLSLGDNKFKESTLPEPDVIRRDEYVETRWDVITYSNVGGDALFLRREEFITVSCECTLRPASASQQGRRPVYWAGDEYDGGQFVEKAYGEVTSPQSQSPFCDECCRDHHDGGSSAEDASDTRLNVYDPFNAPASGNHAHYRVSGGSLVQATNNQTYLEVCRMVRDQGFFRVAQDLRQEDLNAFPGNFLDDESEVDTYSAYITHVANQYDIAVGDTNYVTAPPTVKSTSPACETAGNESEICPPTYGGDYPDPLAAGEFPVYAALNNAINEEEQLRSRGLYIDYLSSDLRNVIDCIRADSGSPETQSGCSEVDGFLASGDVVLDRSPTTNILELLPFFELQLTFLNKWNTSPLLGAVSVTNEALADNNAHSRGYATTNSTGVSDLEVDSWTSNLGLTDTVVFRPGLGLAIAELELCSHDASGLGCGNATPPPPIGPTISGNISESVPGNPAWSVSGSGGDTTCTLTPSGFTCTIDSAATSPTLTISGYGKAGTDRYACAPTLTTAPGGVINGTSARAVFDLSGIAASGGNYNISIQASPCS